MRAVALFATTSIATYWTVPTILSFFDSVAAFTASIRIDGEHSAAHFAAQFVQFTMYMLSVGSIVVGVSRSTGFSYGVAVGMTAALLTHLLGRSTPKATVERKIKTSIRESVDEDVLRMLMNAREIGAADRAVSAAPIARPKQQRKRTERSRKKTGRKQKMD